MKGDKFEICRSFQKTLEIKGSFSADLCYLNLNLIYIFNIYTTLVAQFDGNTAARYPNIQHDELLFIYQYNL